ncbi:MAG: metal-sensing transcriptional repressor [Solobacterium sp.]|nr:metal-sensing transcriptional repressor [Solobacterium sp.]
MKNHTHDPQETKKILNRLARSIGHLESVKNMVERDADCSDVLIQLAAVKGEINNISKLILKQHLDHCIVHAIEDHDHEAIEKMNDAINHLLK